VSVLQCDSEVRIKSYGVSDLYLIYMINNNHSTKINTSKHGVVPMRKLELILAIATNTGQPP
jgi:hypothetical protein